MTVDGRRRRRVTDSHRIAGVAFTIAGVFGLASVVWAVVVIASGDSWWGPIHAFLAGTMLFAISGATQLFTITWSAAPAPPAVMAAWQRWTLALGIGSVLIGMPARWHWLVGIGAIGVVTGLAILGRSLIDAVRRSLLRRFDFSVRFYLLAIASGALGVTLGGLMGMGLAGTRYEAFRLVHSHLNLIGLLGLTIVGTLPTILATFAHHKTVSGREIRTGLWLAVAGVASIAVGLFAGATAVGVGSILAAASLLVVLAGVVGRLGLSGRKGGLPYYQVTAGSLWLAGWATVDGARLAAGSPEAHFAAMTGAVVVAGIGQILLGSLAYLVPVLTAPPPRLGRNLERTHANAWIPLTLANVAGLALVVGWTSLAAWAGGLWVLDFARRLLSMERRAPSPDPT